MGSCDRRLQSELFTYGKVREQRLHRSRNELLTRKAVSGRLGSLHQFPKSLQTRLPAWNQTFKHLSPWGTFHVQCCVTHCWAHIVFTGTLCQNFVGKHWGLSLLLDVQGLRGKTEKNQKLEIVSCFFFFPPSLGGSCLLHYTDSLPPLEGRKFYKACDMGDMVTAIFGKYSLLQIINGRTTV